MSPDFFFDLIIFAAQIFDLIETFIKKKGILSNLIFRFF